MSKHKEKQNDINVQQSQIAGQDSKNNSLKNKPEKQQISFKIIRNDESIQNGKHLIDLKNIFSRQLPKMPKQYIVKLIFDKHHESIVILKNGKTMMGGICFRQFTQQKFAQIAFLAVTTTQQIKGFGTKLMNRLKQEMQKRKMQYLITYADNLALGYFKKQGFSKQSLMGESRWKGFIKDYQGGTMMECKIYPSINYSIINDMIKKQKAFIIQKIKNISINKNVYQGKKVTSMTKQPLLRLSSSNQQEYFKVNPEQIPGVKQSGWTWDQHDEYIKNQQYSLSIECHNIIQNLRKHTSSWPFRQPVSQLDVPDYYMIIKEPMDLRTIEKKLDNQQYTCCEDFKQDIMLIFQNCRLYNQPQTVYYKHSNQLEEYVKPMLQDLKKMQIRGDIKEKRIIHNKPNKKKNRSREVRMDYQ